MCEPFLILTQPTNDHTPRFSGHAAATFASAGKFRLNMLFEMGTAIWIWHSSTAIKTKCVVGVLIVRTRTNIWCCATPREQVGNALKKVIPSVVEREELFITTKVIRIFTGSPCE